MLPHRAHNVTNVALGSRAVACNPLTVGPLSGLKPTKSGRKATDVQPRIQGHNATKLDAFLPWSYKMFEASADARCKYTPSHLQLK